MKKTPEEIRKEMHDFIDALPKVDAKDLKQADTFVIAGESYTRVFGNKNLCQYVVTKKTRTMIKYALVGYQDRVIQSLSFSRGFRDFTLRRSTCADVDRVEQFYRQISAAERHQRDRHKKSGDRYVLWNFICEEKESTDRYTPESVCEGVVIEVFDGNGGLLDRQRILSEGCLNIVTGDEDERIVRAYAAGYWNRERIKSGSKFQIHKVWQMD